MSLFIDIFLTEAYTYDEAERLVNAALNRLSAIGSVGVKTSESTSTSPFASTSTATPPTTPARIQGTSTTASAGASRYRASSDHKLDRRHAAHFADLAHRLAAASPGLLVRSLDKDGLRTSYRAGAFYPTGVESFVEEFAGSDVEHNGQYIAWIELYHLRPGVPGRSR